MSSRDNSIMAAAGRSRPARRGPRVALVLGAGGFLGGAWMAGALHAIKAETGWTPRDADYLIGTSAGAMVAALLALGVPPERIGPELDATGGEPSAMGFHFHWHFPRPALGSPALALKSLREPWRYGPAGIMAWLPRGVISTTGLRSAIKRRQASGWPLQPHTWIVATDYETGERIAFGRPGAPATELADAVAASCAIPGFYFPVTIGGRRYVDGGVQSPSNLDLAAATPADLVICLNPMSSRHRGSALGPTGRIATVVRGNLGRRLGREAAVVVAAGKRVELLQPGAGDLEAIGLNYMNSSRRDLVFETSVETTREVLRSGTLAATLGAIAGRATATVSPSTTASTERRAS